MKKILIVDDEEKIARIYKSLLADEGYEVFEANDSHSATHLLVAQKDIDLILLDIRMPSVNGVMLCEIAREYNPEIKVIVTSACPLEDQKRLIIKADDYYEKSQGLEMLLSKIKTVLEGEGKETTNLMGVS